jgi:hypothetical protein
LLGFSVKVMTMTKTLIQVLVLGGFAALALCCDNGGQSSSSGLGTNDCPLGTFRPVDFADCVFPADDLNGNPLSISDNRCAVGQPAVPPSCISDLGGRPYLALSKTTCAANYRFVEGSCERNGFSGTAGVNGFAGTSGEAGATFTGEGTGTAGTGAAGDAFAGTTGTAGVGDMSGAAGVTGAAGAIIDSGAE